MPADPRLADHHVKIVSGELALAVREAERALKHYNSEWYGGHFGLRGAENVVRRTLARREQTLLQRLAAHLDHECGVGV
jgi:hypothetical protein